MYKQLILLCAMLLLGGCQPLSNYFTDEIRTADKSMWVFMQLNVAQESGQFDSYYYYASISKKLYHQIKNNEIKQGFIHLSQVKYWGSDDLIHSYQNAEDQGDITFRIEDIKKINPVNQEPISGLGVEQFERATSPASNPNSI